MSELKTKPNDDDVEVFLNRIENPEKRLDALTLCHLFEKVTGEKPKMWGPSIVGFGSYHYRYASGQEGDWFIAGFSPRKANFSLYMLPYLDDSLEPILKRLGKYKTGKSCLYINKLSQIDIKILEELLRAAVAKHRSGQPEK